MVTIFIFDFVTVQTSNRVGKIADFCHEYGKGFGKRAAQPHPIFLGVSNQGPCQRRSYEEQSFVCLKQEQEKLS